MFSRDESPALELAMNQYPYEAPTPTHLNVILMLWTSVWFGSTLCNALNTWGTTSVSFATKWGATSIITRRMSRSPMLGSRGAIPSLVGSAAKCMSKWLMLPLLLPLPQSLAIYVNGLKGHNIDSKEILWALKIYYEDSGHDNVFNLIFYLSVLVWFYSIIILFVLNIINFTEFNTL